MQRQGVGIGVVGGFQLQAFVRPGDAHFLAGQLHELLLARRQLPIIDLTQFTAGGRVEQFAGDAGRQAGLMSTQLLCQWIVNALQCLITRFEQRGAVASAELGQLLAQRLAAHLHGMRWPAEGFCEQVFGLLLVQGAKQCLQHIAVGLLVKLGQWQGFVSGGLPDQLALLIDETQALAAWPATMVRQQLQLRHGVDAQVFLRIAAIELVAQPLQFLIDLEALDAVGQKWRQGLLISMHFAQGIFVDAADLQNRLALGGGKRLYARPDALQRSGAAPLQWLLEFGVPGAGTVVSHNGLIGVGAGRVFDTVLAGDRAFVDGEVCVVERQQLLALMLMQAKLTGL